MKSACVAACLLVASASAWTFQHIPSSTAVGRSTIRLPLSLEEIEAGNVTETVAYSLPTHINSLFVEANAYYDQSYLDEFDGNHTAAVAGVVTAIDAVATALLGESTFTAAIHLGLVDVQFLSDTVVPPPAEVSDTDDSIDACKHVKKAADALYDPPHLTPFFDGASRRTPKHPELRRTPSDVNILLTSRKYADDKTGCTSFATPCGKHAANNWIVASRYRNAGAYSGGVFKRVIGYLLGLHLGMCPFGEADLPVSSTTKQVKEIVRECAEERAATYDADYVSNSLAGVRSTAEALSSEMVNNDATMLRLFGKQVDPLPTSVRAWTPWSWSSGHTHKDKLYCLSHPAKWHAKNPPVCGNGVLEYGETCDPVDEDLVPTGGNSTHCLMCHLRATSVGVTALTAFVSDRRTCDPDTLATAITCGENGTLKDDGSTCIASSKTGDADVGMIIQGVCLHKNDIADVTGHYTKSSSSDEEGYDAMVVGGIALGAVAVVIVALVAANWSTIKARYQKV